MEFDSIRKHIGFLELKLEVLVLSRRKQETTSLEDHMVSCIKILTNEKEEVEYVKKISAIVDAQEADVFSGFSDKFTSTIKGIQHTERIWKASMAGDTGSNIENVTEVINDENVPKVYLMAIQDETLLFFADGSHHKALDLTKTWSHKILKGKIFNITFLDGKHKNPKRQKNCMTGKEKSKFLPCSEDEFSRVKSLFKISFSKLCRDVLRTKVLI